MFSQDMGKLAQLTVCTTQLEQTLAELRQKRLEANQPAPEPAVIAANDEVAQLQATITALRDQVEKLHFEKQRAVEESVAHSADEVDQLKKMVLALREQLEEERARHEEEMQAIRLRSRDESAHLQGMVVALRDRLEQVLEKMEKPNVR
jgi:predicted  nucleic acid-binding Zn-ribbon protein